MSDNKRGLPHDLPEYTPNWPVAIKVRARVFKGLFTPYWYWTHPCPRKVGLAIGLPYLTHAAAFEAALKHARGCW